MSDVPIRHSKKMRQWMLASQKMKTPVKMLGHIAKLRPAYFSPELPGIAEFSTNEVTGHFAEVLCKRFPAEFAMYLNYCRGPDEPVSDIYLIICQFWKFKIDQNANF